MNDLGQDLELRLVRYFTAVAEHQTFAKAAAELHLAQPALSRQIQRLEKRLGARLLDRIPQGTRLTPAGKAFLPQAQALLQAALQAELTVRDQAALDRLTIGYAEDLVITPAVRELRHRHPAAEITTRHLSCRDVGALSDGRVDVLVARSPLPLPAADIRTTLLYEEPRMLVVPLGHPLADRTSVTSEELDAFPEAPCTYEMPGWTTYRLLGADVPMVESYEDKLELVAGGQAIAVLPVGDRRTTLRPDLVTIPLENAPTSKVIIVSRKDDPNPMIKAFRQTAKSVLTEQAA
ncbi:LysR family transcriptional regulator [Winogradskya humida]|uniref:LysR family transcriptional regulator n=1 Tax=Winogradskya humida TaxID=113566 RepID=A0ABQ4A269_9ACTN|nr:LysR family transcriptional regulator [Actinoplanes humidus]GIE24927.1 LysR family transcriptional regulator [Actinoplanes humidus]